MNKSSSLFIIVGICFPALLPGQAKCDTAAIAGFIRQSEELLAANQLEQAMSVSLNAFNTALHCQVDTPLLERAFLQADDCYSVAAQDHITRGLFSRSIDLSERNIALHRQMPIHFPARLAISY